MPCKKHGKTKSLLEQRDSEFGKTPLLWAAESGQARAARDMIDAGANVDEKCTMEGETQGLKSIKTYSIS